MLGDTIKTLDNDFSFNSTRPLKQVIRYRTQQVELLVGAIIMERINVKCYISSNKITEQSLNYLMC